jgi:hypothetical protein
MRCRAKVGASAGDDFQPHKPTMQKANQFALINCLASSRAASNRLSSRRSAVQIGYYHNQMGIAEDTLVPDPVPLITQAKTGRLIKKLAIKYGSLVVCLKVLKDFDKSRLYFLGRIRLNRAFPL